MTRQTEPQEYQAALTELLDRVKTARRLSVHEGDGGDSEILQGMWHVVRRLLLRATATQPKGGQRDE